METDVDTGPLTSVDEIFGILGNETRMNVMRVLWEEFNFQDYVMGNQEPISYSDIRKQLGNHDPGNLNYHLGELVELTIQRSEDGYTLTPLGYNLLRTIYRFDEFRYTEIEPTILEEACPFCDGRLQGRYERELVHVACLDCWGLGDGGTINYISIPASSTTDVSLKQLIAVGTLEIESRIRYTKRGLCPDCYHELDRAIDVCADHAPDSKGKCPTCQNRFGRYIMAECPACGFAGAGPLVEFALVTPKLRHAFDVIGKGPSNAGRWAYRLHALGAVENQQLDRESSAGIIRFDVGEEIIPVNIDLGDVAA